VKGWVVVRHQNSRFLFEYWNSLRGNRPAPERSEIEPGELRDVLGDTFILEVSIPMRTILYRLAGTRLCTAYGRELKGFGYLAQWREEDNYELARGVNLVYNDYTPVVVSFAARGESGRFVDYESLLLPLAPTADGSSRILGIATPGEQPYWLGTELLEYNHLHNVRPIEIKMDTTSFWRNLKGHTGYGNVARNVPRRVGHLTIHTGGRS
jgi:hypothetical protein